MLLSLPLLLLRTWIQPPLQRMRRSWGKRSRARVRQHCPSRRHRLALEEEWLLVLALLLRHRPRARLQSSEARQVVGLFCLRCLLRLDFGWRCVSIGARRACSLSPPLAPPRVQRRARPLSTACTEFPVAILHPLKRGWLRSLPSRRPALPPTVRSRSLKQMLLLPVLHVLQQLPQEEARGKRLRDLAVGRSSSKRSFRGNRHRSPAMVRQR